MFSEIDSNLRIGEIELGSGASERLLGHWIAGHKKRELLIPLAGPGNLLLGYIFYFGCYSFHTSVPMSYWNRGSSSLPISSKLSS